MSESGLGWPSEAGSEGTDAVTRASAGESVPLGWPEPSPPLGVSRETSPSDEHPEAETDEEFAPESEAHREAETRPEPAARAEPVAGSETESPSSSEPPGEVELSDVAGPEGPVGEEKGGASPLASAPSAEPVAVRDRVQEESAPVVAVESAATGRRLVRPKGAPWPRPARTRVVTIANQKGGVGKTTTAVNLAASLNLGGLRVLVIDTDPQGNASTALGIDHSADVESIYDVLVNDVPLGEVVQEAPLLPGLLCVPATIELAGAEIELVSFVAREMRLQRAIDAYLAELAKRGEYLDYVIIDCPPSLGLLTINAFVAGEEVLIPIQCEYYALEGLSMLIRNIDMIKKHLNPRLHISTILLTMYDARTRLSAQVADEVRHHFADQVLKAMVPRSVRVSEAPSHGETVLTYDPMSTGSLAYLDAAREFATRGIA